MDKLFTLETKGLQSFNRKMEEIIRKFPDAAQMGVHHAAESTQRLAVTFARGVLKRSIRVEVVDTENWDIKASRVFNDTDTLPWSSYVEFGTGRYVDDEGVAEAERLKRAERIPWYIHVSMVPSSFARYGYPLVVGRNGEQYWEVDGMKPKPYLHPAAFQNRDKNVGLIAKTIGEMLREVCK